MSEGSDYEPADWAPDTFASARKTYDSHVGRSYNDAISKGVTASDLLPARITTDAKAPIVVIFDETGSMGDWPATMFAKLPYMVHEAQEYFGPDYAIAVGAFGDANCSEDYPVQMRPFAKDSELQTRLTELVIEKGGGGQMSESAELAALYAYHNIDMPNATHPVLIFITDEKAYSLISPDQAKQYAKVDLSERVHTKALFESLMTKFNTYVIRKPYSNSSADSESSDDRQVRLFWENLVGADHMALLPDASRVVDVIFGIFAKVVQKVPEFRKELTDRQLKDAGGAKKVETVLKALGTIHRDLDDDGRKALPPGDPSKKKLPAPNETQQHSQLRRDPGTKTKRSDDLL